MARTITSVSIFLASPSDVEEEREFVARIVQQWNAVNSRHKGVSFDLLRWEDSVSAGFGNDGQEVINSQIPSDYDVLVGLFWSKFGSPTPRGRSGSVEEYERAFARYKNGEKVELALFFKDEPVDFRAADLNQLKALKDFEIEVQDSGALTKKFKGSEELRFEIDILLDRISRNFDSNSTKKPAEYHQEILNSEDDDDDDIGLYDVVESMIIHSESATKFLGNLTNALDILTGLTGEVTSEIQTITNVRPLEIREAKPFAERIAEGMNAFSTFLEENSSIFDEDITLMAGSIRSMINISYDFMDEAKNSPDALINFQVVLTQSFLAMRDSEENLIELLSTTSSFQRTTSTFNRAKKRLGRNLNSLVNSMKNNRALVEKALQELSILIANVQPRQL